MCWIHTFIAMLKFAVVISGNEDWESAMELLNLSSHKAPASFAPTTAYVEPMYRDFYRPCEIRHSNVSVYSFENQSSHLKYFHNYGEIVPHGTIVEFGCSDGEIISADSPSWDTCHNSAWVKLDSGKEPRCVVNGGECKVPYVPYANMTIPRIDHDGMVKHLTRINVECEHGSYPKFNNTVIVCIWGSWSNSDHGTNYELDELSSLCSQPETYHVKQTPETESLSDFGLNTYKGDCIPLYVPGAYYSHHGLRFAFSIGTSHLHKNGTSISVFCFYNDKPPAVGSEFMTCRNGSWTFPGGFPNCQMDCKIPAMLIYGAELLMESNVRWIRDTGRLGFNCADGFRMVKNSQSNPSVICANGQWKADPQHYGYCTNEVANRDKTGTERHVNESGLERHAAMFGVPCSLPHPQIIQIGIDDSLLVEHGTFREFNCPPKYEQMGDRRVFCYNGELIYRSKPNCLEKQRKGCLIPTIARSRLPAGKQVASGTRLEVKCVFGYYRVGSSHLFCEAGNWYPIAGKSVSSCVPVVHFAVSRKKKSRKSLVNGRA